MLNYNDMSIKEAAFYLTDKKGKILCGSGKDWAYGEEIENLQKQDPSISIYQGSVLEDAYQMYYSVKSSEYATYSTYGIVILGFLVLSLLFLEPLSGICKKKFSSRLQTCPGFPEKFTVGISGQERNIIQTATKWKK